MSHKSPQDIMGMWKDAKAAEAAPKPKGLELFGLKPIGAPSSAPGSVVLKHPSTQEIKNSLSAYKLPGAEPIPRERMFKVRRLPEGTVKVALSLVAEVNESARKAISIARCFQEFVVLNDTPPGTLEIGLLLLLFVIDMTLQGLALSSARTYARSIIGIEGRAGRPIGGPFVDDLFKIIELLHASEEVEHALDITYEKALEVLRLLNGDALFLCWLMVHTGARAKDLQRMRFAQFTFHVINAVAVMKVHFKYTKGRRSETKQYVLPVKLGEDVWIPEEVKSRFQVTYKDAFLIKIGADELNKAIDRLGPQYSSITSYSFRRLFVHRVIDMFKDDEGHIAWAEVVKLTGHIHVETLRTSYARVEDRVL